MEQGLVDAVSSVWRRILPTMRFTRLVAAGGGALSVVAGLMVLVGAMVLVITIQCQITASVMFSA